MVFLDDSFLLDEHTPNKYILKNEVFFKFDTDISPSDQRQRCHINEINDDKLRSLVKEDKESISTFKSSLMRMIFNTFRMNFAANVKRLSSSSSIGFSPSLLRV